MISTADQPFDFSRLPQVAVPGKPLHQPTVCTDTADRIAEMVALRQPEYLTGYCCPWCEKQCAFVYAADTPRMRAHLARIINFTGGWSVDILPGGKHMFKCPDCWQETVAELAKATGQEVRLGYLVKEGDVRDIG